MSKTKATDHSPRFALISGFYKRGTWSKKQVEKAAELGHITAEELAELVGDDAE